MCPSGEGWLRIIHQPTYSTDYYHLNETTSTPPSSVTKNATLGVHSTNTCAGGYSNGAHVHFALRTHTTNGTSNGVYVTFDGRTVGGWTFNTAGASSGNGSATSTRTGNKGKKGDPFYNYTS